MECQVKKNEHFQHLLPSVFNQGSKAAKAADFHQRDIENLVEHWDEVASNNREYIIE